MRNLVQEADSVKTLEKQPQLKSKIEVEQVRLLYEQLSIAVSGEVLAALFLGSALWNVVDSVWLIGWLVSIFVFSDVIKVPFVYLFYHKNYLFLNKTWLMIFIIGTTVSGIAWGVASSILIPKDSILHQIFVVFLITGVTAAANLLYSPVRLAYTLFLIPSFGSFTIWLFLQGKVYFLLGFCGIIYIFVMLFISYYSNKLLLSTLKLRFKITDLSSMKQVLEKKVAARTSELEKLLALTKSTLESTADGILVVDRLGNIEYYNQKFLDMWSLPVEFIMSHNDEDALNHVLDQLINPDEFLTKVKKLYSQPEQESFDELHFKDGKIFERYSKPHWMEGRITGRVWSFSDVTLRTRLAYQANHDSLTGLLNRASLYDRIEQAIHYAKRLNTSVSLLFLDIDDFKLINDNLGHDAGDVLLQKIGMKLSGCVRQSDTVARFGGDEFVLLLMTSSHRDTVFLAQKILKNIRQPIYLAAQEVIVSTSIGISIYPKDGTNATTLLKNADMAMYFAKKEGRNNFQFYNNTLHTQSLKRLEMQTQLYNAIKNNEFFISYQPIYNLNTAQLIGVEALVRWQNPRAGVILPDDFIPIAEETGLINQLGKWVLKQACMQNKQWQNQGLPPICMAINVSWRQLKESSFVKIVENALEESKLDPQYLDIEFTESSMMKQSVQIDTVLLKLSKMGLHMSIDDFGTGYSNLSYLKTFPVNKVKIDQSFVHDCTRDPNDASIVEAIIAMAHGLKLAVVAEGVDAIEQAHYLKRLGCDEAQGFLYSPPVPAAKIAEFLQAQSRG